MRRALPHITTYARAIVLLAIVFFGAAGSAKATDDGTVRSAFLLGFFYGNANNLYSRNLSLSGDAGRDYDSWMTDAGNQAERLGVALDVVPPPIDPSSSTARDDAIRASRQSLGIVGIKVMAQHGEQADAALQLGYIGAIAPEYLPLLPPDTQQKSAEEFAELAEKIALPQEIIERYIHALTASTDRTTNIIAMFDFKNDVVQHFESLRIDTVKGSRDQLSIWSMGWKLGLATLGQTRRVSADVVNSMFEESRAFADTLDVRIPTLPEASTDSASDTAQAIHYLLNQVGDFVNPQLKNRFGPQAEALFELSVKSTLAMILYSPDDEMGQTLRKVFEERGREAGLPWEVYGPLVQLMSSRAPYAEVKEEIIAQNEKIILHYTTGQTQSESTEAPSGSNGGSEFITYTDPNRLFSMSIPSGWLIEREEGWNRRGYDNTYLTDTVIAPKDAHLADIGGYLSEGVRITFHQPPDGQDWAMSKVEDWAPTYMEGVLEANPGFVVTKSVPVALGDLPAIEYQIVGENGQIQEPEKAFYILVANERFRLVINISSPVSRLDFFSDLRQVVLKNFKLR